MTRNTAQQAWPDMDTPPPPDAEKDTPEKIREKYKWLTDSSTSNKNDDSAEQDSPSTSIELQSIGPSAQSDSPATTPSSPKPRELINLTLVSYGNQPALSLSVTRETSVGPGVEMIGSKNKGSISLGSSLSTNAQSLEDTKLSGKHQILGSPFYVDIGVDGGVSVGYGYDLNVAKGDFSKEVKIGAADIYINLVCPRGEKCGDFGVKARALNVTDKIEGTVYFDVGAETAGRELTRNIQNWLFRQ